MAEQYRGMAIGIIELDSEWACFGALDAAAKAAAVQIQGVERNRLGAGACVKMRGSISDVKAASSSTDSGSGEKPSGSRCLCKDAGKYFGCESSDGSGDPDGRADRKSCFTHSDRIPI